MLGASRPEVRLEPDASRAAASRGLLPRRPHATATCRGSRRRSSRCPAGSPKPAAAGWPSRSTSSRRSAAFNGGSVEHALRAAVQQQRQVGYVFAGSEPSADGADARAEAAVLQGRPGDAPAEDPRRRFAAFIESRFKATGFKPAAGPRRRRSSISPATCPTTCSASRTRSGTTCRADGPRRVGPRRPAPAR